MPAFNEQLEQIRLDRAALQHAQHNLYLHKINIQQTQSPSSYADFKEALAANNAAFEAARLKLANSIKTLYQEETYKTLTNQLSADYPVLFLPVRIETRFAQQATGQTQLWIRIYPDDIHVHTHEVLLTEEEWAKGKAYWRALLAANRGPASDREAKKQKAWEILSSAPGQQRGLWIAKQTQPLNWVPTLAVADEDLDFPPKGDTKTHAWTQAPRTQLLPDKFVVRIYKGETVVAEEAGKAIPDVVFLGPDPFKAEEAFKKTGENITFDEDFAWTSDFEKAVEIGLGLKINLQPAYFSQQRLDRIVVMGLLASADPEESKLLLEQAIENHHYSKGGFSLLAQGTATNNTEADASAYTRNEDLFEKGYYDGDNGVSFEDNPQAEGFSLAKALGIDPAYLTEVKNAGMTEQAEAKAMNTALYPGTIGYFLEVLMKPVIPEASLLKIRNFFNQYVTARGPLAACRIGNQPYGLLLTSDLNTWQENDSLFYQSLAEVLKKLQGYWVQIAQDKALHVEQAGDPGEIMLQLLALEAGSVSFSQRLATMVDFNLGLPDTDKNALKQQIQQQQTLLFNWLKGMGYNPSASNTVFPWLTNLLFYPNDQLNPIPLKNLVDGRFNTDDRFLEPLEGLEVNYIEWLAQLTSIDVLENQNMGGATPPRNVLYLMLRHALLQILEEKVATFYNLKEINVQRGAFIKSFNNFQVDQPDLTSWELLKGVPHQVNADIFSIQEPLANHFLKLAPTHTDAVGIGEVRAALKQIATLSTAKLQSYLTDHLDLCAYRLDAWQTGLFTRRMEQKRMQEPNGLYIGAFGWVENLEPKTAQIVTERVPIPLQPEAGGPVYKQRENAGFVHTPSLNHATAAGLLLAGYQNHASPTDPGTFAINLSSERVRSALFVYEGIRNGQALEALLGYQFERALHDLTSADPLNGNLNQYLLAFREKFPIEAHSIPQQGAPEAQEVISPYNVVNGLKLLEDNGAVVPTLVTNITHANFIRAEISRLQDTLDAINDLLVAESAYQVTQGNYDRTVAVLNSTKRADVPPDLEVAKTPRSNLLTYINRVSIHFDPKAPFKAGTHWSGAISPRALMEPGLNQWLATVIGDPMTIVCQVVSLDSEQNESQAAEITLANLSMHPIDVVYIIGAVIDAGASELESRIAEAYRRRNNIALDVPVKIYFHPILETIEQRSFAQMFPLLRQLRLMITTARPANAKDFAPHRSLNAEGEAIEQEPDLLYGWDVEDLTKRLKDVKGKLVTELGQIGAKAPNDQLPKNDQNPATFNLLFEQYFANGKDIGLFDSLEISPLAMRQLNDFFRECANYGMTMAYPDDQNFITTQRKDSLLSKAAALWQGVKDKISKAEQQMAAAIAEQDRNQKVNRLIAAGKALLGEEFMVIPRFTYTNPDQIAQSQADQGEQLLAHIRNVDQTDSALAMEAWLQSLAKVRPAIGRLETIRTISEALGGEEFAFMPVQTPFRPQDSWLAVEFPETYAPTGEPFQIANDTIALAIHGKQAAKTTALQSALLIDEWTETVPVDKEITGIAFHYDQPNASPPNSLLLAIEPSGASHWDWEVLQGILSNTLQRAKTRAVEPAHLLEHPVFKLMLPMTIATFDLQNANISLDYLVANDHFIKEMQVHDFELYKVWTEDN